MQEWAMRYHKIVILIVSCLMGIGIWGLDNMKKNEFPNFTIRQGLVVALYPGATSENVEQQVTKPLENYIFTYNEVKRKKTISSSRDGMSIIQVELNDDVKDKDAFWSKFRHGLDAYGRQLPQGVVGTEVIDDFGETSAILIAMESKQKTYRQLNEYMKQLEDSLRTINEIGRVQVYGMQKEQISVTVNNERLSHYGLTSEQVTDALMKKGCVTGSGRIKDGTTEYPIYVDLGMQKVAELKNIQLINNPVTHSSVRLMDIADVAKEYPKPESYINYNGTKTLLLSIEMKKGADITSMGEKVNDKLLSINQSFPKDVKIQKITDQSKVVEDSIYSFFEELLIAIVAVIAVVMLLMPLRVALVASGTIPVTIAISLGALYAFDMELNTVTLAALIVTLGMIVDDSIVIIDNYIELLSSGISRWHAAIESARHFFKSILSATLSISITFFPLIIFMNGGWTEFFESFPWAITIILFISMYVAQLVVPILQYFFIKPENLSMVKTDNRKKKFSMLEWLQIKYKLLLDLCFKHPAITIGSAVLSVIVGCIMLSNVPQQLMPDAERNQFAVEISLPTGTVLERTAQISDSLENMMRGDSGVVSVTSFIGTSSPRFHIDYAPQLGGSNFAQFIVNTTDNKMTELLVDKYKNKYSNYFPDANVRIVQLSFNDDAHPVEVRLTGGDLDSLSKAADIIAERMRNMPELQLVQTSFEEPLHSLHISPDEQQMHMLNMTNAGLQQTMMLQYSSGLKVATLWEGDYGTDVVMKSQRSDSATVNDVKNELIPVHYGFGNAPLRQLAKFKSQLEYGQITHRGGLRSVTVSSEVSGNNNVIASTEHLIKKLDNVHLPNGVSLSYGGRYAGDSDQMPGIIMALITSVVIIFFILLWHFKSIGMSLLMISCLVLCVFGAALGLIIQGVNFSITSVLGIVSLMGILVRNGIILFDYAHEIKQKEHLTTADSIYYAALRRMRPIFLTSAAASMGVVPMVISGSYMWAPMGAVICYGTMVTMLFILTVMPVAYKMVVK